MFHVFVFFFVKQKTAYEMRISDWSSDVCSSDRMPKPIAARFKQAVEISEDRPAEACAAWQAIDAEMPDHPSVVFNLGLCAEAGGAYETALRHYRHAQQRDPKGRDVRDALARVPQPIGRASWRERMGQ